jgi:hypothetical protein
MTRLIPEQDISKVIKNLTSRNNSVAVNKDNLVFAELIGND